MYVHNKDHQLDPFPSVNFFSQIHHLRRDLPKQTNHTFPTPPVVCTTRIANLFQHFTTQSIQMALDKSYTDHCGITTTSCWGTRLHDGCSPDGGVPTVKQKHASSGVCKGLKWQGKSLCYTGVPRVGPGLCGCV